jgi:LuxR family maltose regulon positive regulatory protein
MLARLDPDSSRLHGRIACELRAALARLQLAAGDLMAAQRWEQGRRQDNVQSPTLRDREARLVARLWLSRGAGAQAMAILAPLLESARQDGRQTDALEIALLTALALDASGNRDAARQSIAAVLADAAGEGYRRLFLDEGAAAADLIRAALPSLTSQPVRRYAQSLLLPFVGQSPAPLELPRQPLSQQERRVLALLAEGRSNPEIASTLIVSVHTVRSQVRSIYRKLGVHTRAAATALALQAERV